MKIEKTDKLMILGSCFASNMGTKLLEEGYDVCLNPFGTIFNPVSIRNSLLRLSDGKAFSEEDCVMMGAGSQLWGSFRHYTRFARPTREEFLSAANSSLLETSSFFLECNKVILTFGTAWCFRYVGDACPALAGASGAESVVTNCLKRPSAEFSRELWSVSDIVELYRSMLAPGGCLEGKEILFTVSPIRHLADGAHGNQISKATLLLAIDELLREFPSCSYFPSYEIVLDELRDYSWYAEDRVHPNEKAVAIVWDRFRESILK